MNHADLSWAAGVLESEGSTRITKATKKNLGHLEVSVVNTDREMVDFFYDRWPGSRFWSRPGGKANHRIAYRWMIAAVQAAAFLEDVSPYLKTQRWKDRSKLALEFQSQKTRDRRICRTDDYHEDQWAFYMRMKELNQRGVDTRNCPDADQFRRRRS